MKALAWMGIALLALAGCGDSDGSGSAFGGGTLCEDVCSWPTSCFGELAPDLGDVDCVDACEASLDAVGPACLEAINAMVVCFGTCNEDDITIADVERCEGFFQDIESAC